MKMVCNDLEILNNIHTVQIKEPLPDEVLIGGLKILSASEQKRYNKYHNWKDAQRFFIGRVVVKSLLSQYAAIEADEIVIETDAYGKPSCSNGLEIEFNISHSGDWVVVVFALDSIGIDIEKVNEADMKIAKAVFTDREFLDIQNEENLCRNDRFFTYWTLKESYVKFKGRGLSIPLNTFEIQYVEQDILAYPDNVARLKLYMLDKAYKLAVCTKNSEKPRTIKQHFIHTLLKYEKDAV